ncbi:MAG: hypothetical protein GY810_17785 [Aureispira sp.]|nr:hypothetical protein [Aureispira sp.]
MDKKELEVILKLLQEDKVYRNETTHDYMGGFRINCIYYDKDKKEYIYATYQAQEPYPCKIKQTSVFPIAIEKMELVLVNYEHALSKLCDRAVLGFVL